MKQLIRFKLNGESFTIMATGKESLLTIIRTNLDKTGTKFGCGIGECGACTVLLNNEAVRSCMIVMEDVGDKEIITIEGLALDGNLHPIQHAFVSIDALQCGFCTPGMILNAYGLLLKNPSPSREEIIKAMDANLCRCGSYNRIVEAIQIASKEMNQKVKL